MAGCLVRGCPSSARIRGLCNRHYNQWWRGDHTIPASPTLQQGPGLSARDAADRVGISYRQVDYWARTDLVRPTLIDTTGSGSPRRYSEEDVALLQCAADLVKAGVTLPTVRVLLVAAAEMGVPIGDVEFVIAGGKITARAALARVS